jgi:hypothetical protein
LEQRFKDIIWDLEPHKVEWKITDIYIKIDPTMPDGMIGVVSSDQANGLQGMSMNVISIDEAGEISSGMWRNLLNRHHSPERFLYRCIYCQKFIDTENVVCDECIKKRNESIPLEGEDPRYNQLILEEE